MEHLIHPCLYIQMYIYTYTYKSQIQHVYNIYIYICRAEALKYSCKFLGKPMTQQSARNHTSKHVHCIYIYIYIYMCTLYIYILYEYMYFYTNTCINFAQQPLYGNPRIIRPGHHVVLERRSQDLGLRVSTVAHMDDEVSSEQRSGLQLLAVDQDLRSCPPELKHKSPVQ